MANPKGFAPWSPNKKTRFYLEQVQEIINAQREHWPLTQRYWLYRLIALKGWSKSMEYPLLNSILNRGCRASLIPWEAIASSRGKVESPFDRATPEDLSATLRDAVQACQFDRQKGQSRRIVLWMETEGMVPLVESTAHYYGATLLAGKGFDTLQRKHDFSEVIAVQGDVLILHCGDLDKSGHTLFQSLEEDLQAFIKDLGGRMELKRIALSEDQAIQYGLQTSPAPPGLNAGNHGSGFTSNVECQLEALDAPDIISIIEEAFETELDMVLFRDRIAMEPMRREEALQILLKEVQR